MMGELARVRREGVAFDGGECERGVVCAAAPITRMDGTALAAVSVTMSHRSPANLNRVAAAVKRTARAISRALQMSPIALESRAA